MNSKLKNVTWQLSKYSDCKSPYYMDHVCSQEEAVPTGFIALLSCQYQLPTHFSLRTARQQVPSYTNDICNYNCSASPITNYLNVAMYFPTLRYPRPQCGISRVHLMQNTNLTDLAYLTFLFVSNHFRKKTRRNTCCGEVISSPYRHWWPDDSGISSWLNPGFLSKFINQSVDLEEFQAGLQNISFCAWYMPCCNIQAKWWPSSD